MSNISPGPWSCTTREKTSLIFSAGREPIAKVCINADGSRLANQTLITAAPDLLIALEAMVKTFGNSTVLSDYGRGVAAQARAAIAKARGE